MQPRRIFAAAVTLGCLLLLGGCREHNEPVKPIAQAPQAQASAALPA